MAEEEDNDNGEEQGGHGGVPAVALGDAVVYQGGPEYIQIYIIVMQVNKE